MNWITTPPLQNTGTSYINNLNCNNINIPSTGIIRREYETPVTDVSYNVGGTRYREYLTVPDCGVYLYNAVDALFPLYTSCNYTNIYTQAYQSNTIASQGGDGVNGSLGVGYYGPLSLANKDDGYIVYPNYAITVYNATVIVLNYQNNTNKPVYVISASGSNTAPNTGDSIKIYYDGVEQT
jgi:hypothetical protein